MSILSCRKKDGDTSNRTSDSAEFSEVWIVETSNARDTCDVAENARGLPRVGSRYGNSPIPLDGYSTKKVGITADGHAIFEVSCRFSNKSGGGKGGGEKGGGDRGNPDDSPYGTPAPDRPTLYSYRTGQIDCVFMRDQDYQPIVNTAGEPFAEGLVTPTPFIIVQMTKYEDDFDGKLLNFVGTVNEKPFGEWHPGDVKFASVTGDQIEEGELDCFRIVYELHLLNGEMLLDGTQVGGWDVFKLNEGSYSLSADNPAGEMRKVWPTDAQGVKVNHKVLLGDQGQLLSENEIAAGGATYSVFKALRRADFNYLFPDWDGCEK